MSSAKILQQQALEWRRTGETIAFVPTMGALHEGHAELLRQARHRGMKLVASIFVNPTQFGPKEDLTAYPRTLEADLALCRSCDVDVAFTPTTAEIYPDGFQTFVEVTALSRGLCGASRPGHFRGVATVVLKLFQIVQPHVALFGEKDYQQLQIIRRMVQDMMTPVEIVGIPTVREADGLAMSSRNRYLSPSERQQAAAIPRALVAAQEQARKGAETTPLCQQIRETLRNAGITAIDYIAIVDATTLEPIPTLDRPARLLAAARVGTTRLIDNVPLIRH